MTSESTYGRKKNVLNRTAPLKLLLHIINAHKSASGISTINETTVAVTVCRKALWKIGSENSFTKFWIPLNFMGPRPFHLKKLKYAARKTGNTTKNVNNIVAGASNSTKSGICFVFLIIN